MPVTRMWGGVLGEGGDELVAAAPVVQAHGAYVPVVAAAGDELGEGELVEGARGPFPRGLHRPYVRDELLRQHQPRQAQAGRQRLADGAAVGDVVGGQTLEGAHGLAVVAQFAVVVVLQDHPARAGGPVDDRGPAGGVQRGAGGELVGRGEQHALDGPPPLQLPDVRAEPVDGQRHRAQAGPFDGVAVVPEAVRLHAQLAHAAPPQGPAQQCEALDEARAHHDPPGVGAHPAGAGEVVGEGLPQLGAASPVAVAERLVRGRGQGAAGGGEPGGAREGGDVAGTGAQVVGGAGGIRG
ncbi:hypothetical protein VR41_06670, partial [Streptomyces sp. NRRL B-1568]